MRQQIERSIQQRMASKTTSSLDNSRFLDELDSDLHHSGHSHQEEAKGYLEGQNLEVELRTEREKLNAIEGQIDKARLRMVEVIREEDGLKEKLAEKRGEYGQARERLEQENKEAMGQL